jgi:hypothetical protein
MDLAAFAADDYDAIAFLDKTFSTEQSLASVEDVVVHMRAQQGQLGKNLQSAVNRQAMSKDTGQQRLAEAKSAITGVSDLIGQIQVKTRQTEASVEEICCDIRQLDAAKQHLTTTVTSLQKMKMLIQALDKLRITTKDRQYRQAAGLLEVTDELAELSEDFQAIPRVGELHSQIRQTKELLRRQVMSDIKRVVGDHDVFCADPVQKDDTRYAAVPALHHQALGDACCVVAKLDKTCREELVTWFCHHQLHAYHDCFPEALQLGHTEKRYTWLLRHLITYDERYGDVFPAGWDVKRQLCYTFCASMRTQFEDCSELRADDRAGETTVVDSLVKAVGFATLFERRLDSTLGSEEQLQLPAEAGSGGGVTSFAAARPISGKS